MSVPLRDQPLGDLLQSLAAKTPTPGGGCAACSVAATGMSLARMVLAWSIDKQALAKHAETNRADDAALGDLTEHAMALAEADTEAYGALNDLWKLPEGDATRQAGWDAAVEAAIDAPMRLMQACTDALDRCVAMRQRTNTMLHSDLNGAIHLLVAALHTAGETAAVNLPLVRDTARRSELNARLNSWLGTDEG